MRRLDIARKTRRDIDILLWESRACYWPIAGTSALGSRSYADQVDRRIQKTAAAR